MFTEILPLEDNACDLKEVVSTVDPNFVVDTLSVSLQLCEPFSATDLDSVKSSVATEIPTTDALLGDFNTIVISNSSGKRDDDGRDNIRFSDASETKFPEIICPSTWRSTRKSILNQKIETKQAGRKCRRTSDRRRMLDISFLKVARQRRSCMCKPARSSSWGLLGNITEAFEQNAGKNVDQNERSESQKGRSVRRGRKSDKNQTLESLQRSKGESQAVTRCIRLKFKLGKKASQGCQLNTVPVMDKDLENNREVEIESPNSNDTVDKLEEEPRSSNSQCFHENLDKAVIPSEAYVLDVLLADKDRSENFAGKGGDNIQGIPSEEGIGVGETVENRCLDPGTSPDSEVINATPETHVSGVASEDLHDILISSKDYVANGDMKNLILLQTSSKIGKKKTKSYQNGNIVVEGGLPSPEIISSVVLCDEYGHKEKMGDGSYSSGASISTTFGVASSNVSSSEGCPMEPLTSSQETSVGVSTELLKVESGEQVDRSVSVGVESPESRLSEKFLPHAMAKAQKLQKSSSSRGMSKSKSEVPDSVNRKRNTSRQKGFEAKSTSKCKIKEKNGDDHAVCQVQSDPETENYKLDDVRELKEGCRTTAGDLSSSSLVPSGFEDQHIPPRNAWVCCDDCHKWRRIPAILADSIEATNSRWICKDNMDKDYADCSIPQEKSNAKINEELEISDASCEEGACDTCLNPIRMGQKQPTYQLQSSWKIIKSNLFLHRHRKNQPIDEIMVCHCKPSLDGRRGCRDGCLNRMLNIECVKGTCPCGELCSNQQFQKRKYAKLKCFRCGKKGYGLQLQEDIPKGRFLIEYVGEVLDMRAYEARQREYASKGHMHFYFMTLNGSEVIDACAKGNLGRFINHSCEPNCSTEKWMVNGEVCIGLFALRDIKKGEEVTFDYNYVRVFGAAAKKCVCGSSRCQGFIGGDPVNAEAIVHGDSDEEFPEPVMLYDDGTDKLDNMISGTSSFDGAGLQSIENPCKKIGEVDKSANVVRLSDNTESKQTAGSLLEDENSDSTTDVGCMEIASEKEYLSGRSSSAASKPDISLNIEAAEGPLPFSVQPIKPSFQQNDGKSEISSENLPEHYVAEEDVKQPVCIGERTETSSLSSSLSLPNIVDTKRKSKTPTVENTRIILKPHRRTKISRETSSVKRGNPKNNAVNVIKPPEVEDKLLPGPCSSKKILEDTLDGRFEAVQKTLSNLLDADGGISKRRDASRGYLKLLYLTAASGGSSNGEGIQSNRDLSMILDALLKTKSRTVLVDITNKNGLQMLHNIMKRYRKDFNKIPILRKLLKVLEYLAERKILTLENINRAPPCPGVESFRESILSLTEHLDKQVHQIARNFRDRWIPWSFRKINCIDRDVDRMKIQRGPNLSRFSTSHDHSSDQDRRPKEAIDDCVKQSLSAHRPPVDAGMVEGSSASCSSSCITNRTKSRKRKTRWDQPSDAEPDLRSPSNKESRSEIGGEAKDFCRGVETSVVYEERQSTSDEDVPPGFSSHFNAKSSTATDFEAVVGYPQERFISRMSISYGVPWSMLGTTQPATGESWFEAPAMPFHPFPPLPSYPRDEREHVSRNHSDQNQNTPTTSGASPSDFVENLGSNHQHNFQRFRGSSNNSLGRRYFRQHKLSNLRSGVPWNSRKNGSGRFIETNNSSNGLGNKGVGMDVNSGIESCGGNSFYQQPQH